MKLGVAFDRLLNLALVGASLYAVVALRASKPQSVQHPKYEIGEKAPLAPGIDYGKTEKTLVFFLRSTCEFCTQSIPFYKNILDGRRSKNAPIQTVALAREDKAIFNGYLADHGLHFDATDSIEPSMWDKVKGTPTVVLVDHEGIVRGTWLGTLPTRQQQELLAAIGLRDINVGTLGTPSTKADD